eukprot:6119576-Amphidinium_carterae.1
MTVELAPQDVFGLQPKETNGAIPQDVRGEHYGVSYGRCVYFPLRPSSASESIFHRSREDNAG